MGDVGGIVKPGIGCNLGGLENVPAADRLKALLGMGNHGLQQAVLLGFTEGLGIDHNLVFGIDAGNPIVALDYAFTCLDLGRFVIKRNTGHPLTIYSLEFIVDHHRVSINYRKS